MRRRFWITLTGLGLIAILVLGILGPAWADYDPQGLQVGDILFMGNTSDPWYTSSTPWTHNAIYVGVVNGVPSVVEAVTSPGVRYAAVVNDGVTWGTCSSGETCYTAVKRLGPQYTGQARSDIINAAVAYAKAQVGKGYDFFFNKYDDSRQYCSELIWHAYMPSAIDLDSNGGSIVHPSDEFSSPQLVDAFAMPTPTPTAVATTPTATATPTLTATPTKAPAATRTPKPTRTPRSK